MRIISRTFAGTAMLALFSTAPAYAADLPSRAEPPAPAPERILSPRPVNRWEGFYMGVSVGGASVARGRGVDLFTYNAPLERVGLAKRSAFIGGIQIGFNQRWRSLVFGVEADISYLGFKSSGRSAFNARQTRYQVKNGVFATIRSRFGFAFDNTLVYMTAGTAIADMRYSVLDAAAVAPNITTFTASKPSNIGTVLGAGIEHAFTPALSAKLEYMWVNFPGRTVIGFATPGGGQFRFGFNRTQLHIVRAGLNYRFGANVQPVVARY